MPIAGPTRTPNDARSIEAGMLLIGAGAILLFVSLFLEWYEPGIEAWDVFEVWDIVLAALAIAALVAVAGRMGYGPPRPSTWLIAPAVVALVAVAGRLGFGPPRPASWLIGPALAALVIVLYLLINPPPLTPDIDGDPSTGLWLALAAAVLMTAGSMLSVARISVAINPADAFGGAGTPGHPRGRADRYDRPGAAPLAGDPVDPVPGPGPGAGPVAPGPGRPGAGTPPTEPTRRI